MDPTSSLANSGVDWRDTVTWYTHETNFIWFIRFAARRFFSLLAQVDCQGEENIPSSGPAVLAANHLSNLDVAYMGAFLPRYPHFMAKKELYKNPIFGWFIRQMGSFPVNRGESDPWALQQGGRVLAAGQLLFMFPEGTRSGQQAQLRRGKVGAVKLALQQQAPVIPAAIWGTEKFRFGWGRRNLIHIRVGRPIDVVALAGPQPWRQDIYRELTEQVMQQIATMLPPDYRGLYG